MGDTAINKLEFIRWGYKPRCIYCWSLNIQPINDNTWREYRCSNCGNAFSVINETPFQRTLLKPDQLLSLYTLMVEDRLGQKPSVLCGIVGVHHWTMTKLIRKIRELNTLSFLNSPTIATFESLLKETDVDVKLMPTIMVMFTYKRYTHDPYGISCITGINELIVKRMINRINLCWFASAPFEEDTHNWYVWEDWEKNTPAVLLSLHLHAMCVAGMVDRNPKTKVYFSVGGPNE